MTELRTDRLTLRPVGESDHAALLAHWTGPRIAQFLFDGKPPTAARVTEFIEASERDFAAAGYGLWAVRLTGSGVAAGAGLAWSRLIGSGLIGTAGLRRLDGGQEDETEIIYSLEPEYWGRGIATEAAGAVLAHAFETVGMDRVIAEIDEGNSASTALAARLGLRPAGTVPGELGRMRHYAITRDEWLSSEADPA